MKRPLAVVGFTVFLSLMLLSELEPWACFAVFGAALFLAIVLSAMRRKKLPRRSGIECKSPATNTAYIATALAVAAACILSWASQSSLNELSRQYSGKTVELSAQVQELSPPRYGRYYAICKAKTADGQAFRFRLSMTAPFQGSQGDILTGKLTFFDYQNPSKKVSLGAYIPVSSEYTVEKSYGAGSWIYSLRSRLLSSVDEYLPNEYGAMSKGLMLGELSGLPAQTNTDFRTLGLTHIIAVSGQHLVIWCVGILMPLFVLLRVKKRTQAVLISVFTLIFMALTGFSDSIVRSGLMLLLTQAGIVSNRRADAINSLGFAVLLICFISPEAALGLGLQLSFLATLGILLGNQAGPKAKEPQKPTAKNTVANYSGKFISFIKESAKCALLAAIFTLPVSMRASGHLGLLTIPANIIFAIPASVAMITSGLCALASLLPGINILTAPLAFISGLCSKFMIQASHILAKVPFASLPAAGTEMRLWICGVMIICAISILIVGAYKINRRPPRYSKRLLQASALLCAALLIAAQAAGWSVLQNKISITLAQTGAVSVVITKGSRTLILGADGDGFNAAGEIMKTLEQYASREVDIVASSSSKNELENIYSVLSEASSSRIFSIDDNLKYHMPEKTAITNIGQGIDWLDEISISYYNEGTARAALVRAQGLRILVLFTASTSLLPRTFLEAEIMICPGIPPELPTGIKLVMVANKQSHAEKLAQMGVRAISHGKLTIKNGEFELE